MIAVSDAWKAIHKESILPESYVEVTYWITEPGVQDLASASNDGAAYYSDHEAITDTADKSFKKYATLENNIWALNGSFDILPNSAPYGDTGFVSDDVAASTITISFPSVRTQPIPGVTIIWSETYGEYATRLRIAALRLLKSMSLITILCGVHSSSRYPVMTRYILTSWIGAFQIIVPG